MIIYYRKKNVSNEYLERLIDCNKIHRVSKYVYFVTLENFNPQKFWRLFLGKYRSSSIRENSLPVKLNFFPVVRRITYARTNMTGKQSRLKTSLSRFEKEREGEGELLNPSMRFPKVFRNVRVAISKIRSYIRIPQVGCIIHRCCHLSRYFSSSFLLIFSLQHCATSIILLCIYEQPVSLQVSSIDK